LRASKRHFPLMASKSLQKTAKPQTQTAGSLEDIIHRVVVGEDKKKPTNAEILAELDAEEDDDLAEFKHLQTKRSQKIPPLVVKLTGYHGTRVPVLMLKFLDSSQVGHLAWCDKFWQRIVKHPSVWRAVFCRDFYPADSTKRRSCVWQNLYGRTAGAERCLFCMDVAAPALFAQECKAITAIPGRSHEELLEGYTMWREARRMIGIETRADSPSEDLSLNEPEIPDWLEDAAMMDRRLLRARTTTAVAENKVKDRQWSMKVQLSYGLSGRHSRPSKFSFAPCRSARGTPPPGTFPTSPRKPLMTAGKVALQQNPITGFTVQVDV